MSEVIYEDLNRTDFERTGGERVEMMVDIYESADGMRDQDFRTNTQAPLQNTGSYHVRNRSSRLTPVCLVLLTAVIVLCVFIYINNTSYTHERNQLRTRINNITEKSDQLLADITTLTEEKDELLTKMTNLTEERDELLIRNTKLTKEKDQLLTNITSLSEEKDQLLSNINSVQLYADFIQECFSGKGGWTLYQSSCYFISSEKKSWTESRRYCRERGADLIIINSKEEQKFAKKMSGDAGVWIGLTDSDEEGRWKWVDGTNVTSGFWNTQEPNGHRTENCVLAVMSWWYDYPCNYSFNWICEKKIVQ